MEGKEILNMEHNSEVNSLMPGLSCEDRNNLIWRAISGLSVDEAKRLLRDISGKITTVVIVSNPS